VENDDDDEKRICHQCVGDHYLSGVIAKDGVVGQCSYCNDREMACITVEELADHIEGAFERHYQRTSDQPDMYESMMMRDKESNYDWDRHGEPVIDIIAEAAALDEEPAQDVLDILSERFGDWEAAQMGDECEFDPDSRYERKRASSSEIAAEWYVLERSLKLEARYFNPQAEWLMKRLFDGLGHLVTDDGCSVVVEAGPGKDIKAFNRARAFHNRKDLEEALIRPDLHLGPPPTNLAKAGRMNAHGIAVFYGADDRDVALAEVRPPVGSKALVGEFELLRTVRLLDVAALEAVYFEGSVFDPAYAEQRSLARFMGTLSDRMTMPVMPDDEKTEYLITQMIADYLARRPLPALDGILFKSVQRPGDKRNVVLFHHASRVEPIEVPEGSEITIYQSQATDDGPEPDYSVLESLPPAPQEENLRQKSIAAGLGSRPSLLRFDPDADVREVYLRMNRETLLVRHVKGVAFETVDFPVRQHRMAKLDL